MIAPRFAPGSPAAAGWRMPAEWERHHATWLTWPRPEGISFPDKYEPVPGVYAEFIRHLAAVEEVNVNVWDAGMEAWVRGLLTGHGCPLERVRFHHFPAYEPWCRDHGPIFLVRDGAAGRERAVVDWGYNAWGNKYPPCDLDDAVPQHVARLRGLPLFSPGIVMEGGSLDVNGAGTLLTTESCLLNPNRNPHLDRAQIERFLRDYLGVRQILWLGDGIVGDHAVGSHEAMLCARGIERVQFEPVVSVPPLANQRHAGIRVHRLGDLRGDMIEYVDGLPLTTVARGVIDVSSTFRRNRLDQLIDQLTITERVTTLGAVERTLRRSNRRGRRGIRVLQELLDARGEIAPRSRSEKLADELLARSDLPPPVHEYPHPGWTLGDAFVDRAWADAMLIVEIDGRSWHQRDRDMQKDRARDRSAGLVGWFTARFLHSEVRDEPDAFIADVVGIYEQRRSQLALTTG